jgi:hypothetical protein
MRCRHDAHPTINLDRQKGSRNAALNPYRNNNHPPGTQSAWSTTEMATPSGERRGSPVGIPRRRFTTLLGSSPVQDAIPKSPPARKRVFRSVSGPAPQFASVCDRAIGVIGAPSVLAPREAGERLAQARVVGRGAKRGRACARPTRRDRAAMNSVGELGRMLRNAFAGLPVRGGEPLLLARSGWFCGRDRRSTCGRIL